MAKRLFVGNLPWGATEEDLRSFLGESAVSVRIVTDRDTGRSRGFAFVEADSDEAAQEMMQQFNGAIFQGRDLRINEAHERPSGGGGGYRGPSRGYQSDRPDKLSLIHI